jgi:hypothetical protein
MGDQAMSMVRQSMGMIAIPNALAIAAGAFGLIGPPLAAIINNGTTCVAVLVETLPLLNLPALRSRFIVGKSTNGPTATHSLLPSTPTSSVVLPGSLRSLRRG